MTKDPRLTPANGRVAALALAGQVTADTFTAGEARRVVVSMADLCRTPDGPRDLQLLFGADVTVFEDVAGWSFVQAARDGYVGYVRSAALGDALVATHHVVAAATHLYAEADFKSPDMMALSFGSRVAVTAEHQGFWETAQGYIPTQHLWPLSRVFDDPVTVAQMFLGVPYLWGGNTSGGIDCSGLVQAALWACAIACPRDSDMQLGTLGLPVKDGTAPQRGDLYFWNGHVGLLVDPDTLIHANAYHMAVAQEPVGDAITRIAAQGGGGLIARKRLG